jgi:REP element-mobilizing transposase RayT
MTYWRLHYHLIWATFERTASITRARERTIYTILYRKAEELGVIVHAAGNAADHIHIVASIPPRLAVAEFVRHVKGASARAVNRMAGSPGDFRWQTGYAALSLGEEALPVVSAYARRQKEHHRAHSLQDPFEWIEEGDEAGHEPGA